MVYFKIFEEHNEALYYWTLFNKKGITSTNSTLLHFDDHSDFRIPIFEESIRHIFSLGLDKIREFVFENVNIDSFIAPAIYLNLIRDFFWIKYDAPKQVSRKMHIRSFNEESQKLILEVENDKTEYQEGNSFMYCQTPPSNFRVEKDMYENIILDIDLDYFSCCENPYSERPIIIEISESEYHQFLENPHFHPLKYITLNVRVEKIDNKFYYVLNNFSKIYPSRRKVTKEIIDERIDNLNTILTGNNILPKAITVCRSVKSGFTPEDQSQYIETELLKMLKKQYFLEEITH